MSYTQIGAFTLAVVESSTAFLTIPVPCGAGYHLLSEPAADLVVEARREGVGAWINLESSSIDLSADDGNIVDYEVRLTAPSIGVDVVRDNFRLLVQLV